jgi:hypothetical protein
MANPNPCEACEGRGWAIFFNTDRETCEIQRCDACEQYESDRAAGEAAVPVIDAALARAAEPAHPCGKGCRCRT